MFILSNGLPESCINTCSQYKAAFFNQVYFLSEDFAENGKAFIVYPSNVNDKTYTLTANSHMMTKHMVHGT